jgi:repressor LexA
MLAFATDMDETTARQQRILDYIRSTVRERGYPPTVREIGEAVGLTSSSSVHAQLENLRKKGLLRKAATKPRAIEVAGRATGEAPATTVPLLGRIAAGAPVLAEEHVRDHLAVPADFTGRGEHFALEVAGESMEGAGILDGDVVVVRQQDVAEDGAIVAALLPGGAEDEATVKRLRRRQGRLVLEPENPAFDPIRMPSGGRILGQIVAVLRKL